jgi:hypothetical protein
MKNQLKIGWVLSKERLFTCLMFRILLFGLTSGVAEAKKFSGLKVHGDYRILEPIVSEVPRNKSGVSREDILQRVRQKLWESGIKPERPRNNTHYLDVDLVILSKGTAFSVEVSLKKMSQAYGYDPREVGPILKLHQGGYGLFGNAGRSKSYVLDAVDEVMDEFLADYKDSNLK